MNAKIDLTQQILVENKPKSNAIREAFEDYVVMGMVAGLYLVTVCGVIPACLKATYEAWKWWYHL